MPGNGGLNKSGLDQLLQAGLDQESIFVAIESGNIERVTNALSRNPNAVFERHNPPKIGSKKPQMGGVTPLLFAVQKERLDMVQLIYNESEDKVDKEVSSLINIPNHGGTTPLIAACEIGSKEIFDFLIEKKANPDKMRKKDGFRALEVVIGKKGDFCCYALNKLVEAETNIKEESQLSKFTPLQVAIKENNKDALSFLLSKLCCDDSKLDKNNTYSLIKTIIDCNNLEALELVKREFKSNLQQLTSKEVAQIRKAIHGKGNINTYIKDSIEGFIEEGIFEAPQSLGKRKATESAAAQKSLAQNSGRNPSSAVKQSLKPEDRVSIAALISEPSGGKGCGI